jgi:hypothetical protein
VAILVAAVAAATIGMTLLTEEGQPRPVTSVTDIERIANSSAAVREQGAALPIVVGISHVAPSVTGFAGFENPGAYVTQAPTYATGLENPAAYGAAWDSVGGPNEALHRQYSPLQETVASGPEPIVVNGEGCMQCR